MPKHNPERRSWRGRSHRLGGASIRDLRDRDQLRADIAAGRQALGCEPDASRQLSTLTDGG